VAHRGGYYAVLAPILITMLAFERTGLETT
jgi:hypothetical protein